MGQRESRNINKNLIKLSIVIIFGICIAGLIIFNYKQKAEAIELVRLELIKKSVTETLPGIVCWGDSLTVGKGGKGVTYPKVLAELISKNIYANLPVINCGVGGETSTTIIGRAGGAPYIIANSFTIPYDISKVKITFTSSDGSSIAPLRQGKCGVNPVTINGIAGNISIEQDSYTSLEYSYYFTRSTPGNSVDIDAGTKIITSGSILYNNYIPVIFIGQNGGWKSYADLISQQMSIVNSQTKKQDKYVILGLTTGTASSRSGLETAMVNFYGDKYINLREYLSADGIYDAGLRPTEKDLEAMKVGSVPPSLLSDSVHLNSYGYTLIGNLVYKRMMELGYFNDIVEIIKKYSIQKLN